MKLLLTILFSLSIFCLSSQEMSYSEFEKEAKINKRFQPKFGNFAKNEDEISADKAFIEKATEEYGSREKASEAMVMAGYQALKKDPREAMINFNQAYLLDSSNADIYWGYGQLYYSFKQHRKAKRYYEEGLQHNPKSTMILNSLGSNCIGMYEQDGDEAHLNDGVKPLQSSFMIDPAKAETSQLLTEIFVEMRNCEKARKYYQVYLATKTNDKKQDLKKQMEKNCP